MKRKPEQNYKLPKYAAGLAAMMLAGSMTGCTETAGDVQIDGGMDVPEDMEYTELAGDAVLEPEETAGTAFTDDAEIVPEQNTVQVTLAGDTAAAPEETCTIQEISETAVEEFSFTGTEPAPPQPEELQIIGDLIIE